jgi:hypothetical protein
MNMRKAGILPAAVLFGLCLAAALGCGGKPHYSVPDIESFSPPQGAVGSTVYVNGADLSDIYGVSFGGQQATVYSRNSNTVITVTVPPTAATGALVVENPAGTGTSYHSFVVTPAICAVDILGYPDYSTGQGLSQTSGTAGTIITVTGYGLSDVTGVTIGGNTCTFTLVNPNMVTVNTTNAATGSVIVTVPGVDGAVLTATSPLVFTVTP